MIVITSFLSPGDVYCSRSVCYLPQGLSVECLNLQAPTFLGPRFLCSSHSPLSIHRGTLEDLNPLPCPTFETVTVLLHRLIRLFFNLSRARTIGKLSAEAYAYPSFPNSWLGLRAVTDSLSSGFRTCIPALTHGTKEMSFILFQRIEG